MQDLKDILMNKLDDRADEAMASINKLKETIKRKFSGDSMDSQSQVPKDIDHELLRNVVD